ncbi:MAG TPA: 3-oxoacyl-ACP synthase III [Lacipirellulaceae bacterium]|jgi:3-oxoacyl-[acyl-carrier-protein] synthase-3|nr:3-oxoacyl-ACP synthase III [Lacipirellulaceae bacterium]
MHFRRVCLESFGYTLPDEVVTTAALECRLAPLYERLRLPEGRLELMTGIRERRFFPPGTRPSSVSIESARRAIAASGIDPHQIGALVHGSVCRDFLEPATACRVHHGAGLPPDAVIYDVSNACLGILNGIVQVANMIELGHVRAGVVVGTECGRELVENTIAHLNSDHSLTRESVKDSIASLTIGSASAAIVLCDEELSQTGNRLTAATVYCDTHHHELCQSRGLETFMDTDSEELMRRGVAAGAETFKRFLGAAGWRTQQIDRTFCHQVGVAHRKLMFESLGLDPAIDFATVETLGNTGSAALPVTMAMGVEQGRLRPDDRVAMLGIGSGINCLMLAVEWKSNPISAANESAKAASFARASG